MKGEEESTGSKVGNDRRRTATGLGIKGRPELREAQSILGSPSENNSAFGAEHTSHCESQRRQGTANESAPNFGSLKAFGARRLAAGQYKR